MKILSIVRRFVLGIIICLMTGCAPSGCSLAGVETVSVLAKKKSPDGSWMLEETRIDEGPTSYSGIKIRIIPLFASRLPSDGQTVFDYMCGNCNAKMKWVGDSKILISVERSDCLKIIQQMVVVNNIPVEYDWTGRKSQ